MASTGRVAFGVATAAVACAAAFTVWVLNASVYSNGDTVLEANPGTGHAIVVAVPLVVASVVWLLLHVACRFDSATAWRWGTALAWLLLALAVVSGFSIGLFFMPAAVLLCLAAALTPVSRA